MRGLCFFESHAARYPHRRQLEVGVTREELVSKGHLLRNIDLHRTFPSICKTVRVRQREAYNLHCIDDLDNPLPDRGYGWAMPFNTLRMINHRDPKHARFHTRSNLARRRHQPRSAPFVIEGTGTSAIKICFYSSVNRREYLETARPIAPTSPAA